MSTGDQGAQAMAEMLRALTTTLQGLSVQPARPGVKLGKFRGTPRGSGDLTLNEWLEEFENYATRYELQGKNKAQALLEHLTGPAKDEILCRGSSVRDDSSKIIEVMKSLFGTPASVSQLSANLHSRTQEEGESLADYSRELMRLYSRIEDAAENDDDKKALERLRDQTLKDRLVRGARDKWVQRELRRIEMASKGKSFLEMREEVLSFFKDEEPSTSRNRTTVREVTEGFASVDAVTNSHSGEVQGLRAEVGELRKELASLSETLRNGSGPRRARTWQDGQELFCFNCGRRGHISPRCTDSRRCFKCGGEGHLRAECPQMPRRTPQELLDGAPPIPDPTPPTNVRCVRSETTETVEEEWRTKFVGKSPTTKLNIAGVELGCVLDTGAETSLIPASVYHEVLQGKIGELGEVGTFISVVGASGVDIPIQGCVEAPLSFGTDSIKAAFLIVDDRQSDRRTRQQEFPVILGCNVLRALQGLTDQVSVGSEDVGLVWESMKLAQPDHPQGSGLTAPVRVAGEELIPPCTVRRVRCEAPFLGENVLLTAIPISHDLGYEAMTYGGHRVKEGHLNVFPADRTPAPLVIESDTQVASSAPVETNDEVLLEGGEDGNDLGVNVEEVVIENDIQNQNQGLHKESAPVVGIEGPPLEAAKGLPLKHSDVLSSGSFDLEDCSVIPHEIKDSDVPPIHHRTVKDVNNHNDWYQIRPASGSELQWVKRRQLVSDSRGVVEEEPDARDRSPDSEDDVTSSSSDDESESDDDDRGIVRLPPEQDECEREEELPPRRSSRSTVITGLPIQLAC